MRQFVFVFVLILMAPNTLGAVFQRVGNFSLTHLLDDQTALSTGVQTAGSPVGSDTTFSIEKFDTSLGSLAAVRLLFEHDESRVSGNMNLSFPGAVMQIPTFEEIQLTRSVIFTIGGTNLGFDNQSLPQSSLESSGYLINTSTLSRRIIVPSDAQGFPQSFAIDVAPDSFDFFSGPGSFDVTFGASSLLTVTSNHTSLGQTSITGGAAFYGGRVTATYVTAVPEPQHGWMLVLLLAITASHQFAKCESSIRNSG